MLYSKDTTVENIKNFRQGKVGFSDPSMAFVSVACCLDIFLQTLSSLPWSPVLRES
ncbi:hypothetical protein LEMLEM_LOCUS7779 [Lemmus lemmus]